MTTILPSAVPIRCRTNIDCAKPLQWPTYLPARPMVGDLIRSLSSTRTKYIELMVVATTWVKELTPHDLGDWFLQVELHLPPSRFENLAAFEKFVKEPR